MNSMHFTHSSHCRKMIQTDLEHAMGNALRWLSASILILASVGIVGCVMLRPIGDITLVETGDQELGGAVAQTGTVRVEVTAYVTGWVEAPANILIDQSDPATPSELSEALWVPSLAYAVTHPQHGVAILDTGLRAGTCDYGLRPVYWVPCRNETGSDLVSQLKADGIRGDNIRFIVLSHFHGDHISGLSSLLDYADATVLSTNASISDVRSSARFVKGVPTSMVSSDMHVQLIDDGFSADELGVAVYDVFGDGSLKLFRTPGHTEGHVSAIARGTERDIVFSFDASHLKANFDLTIPSGAVSSRKAAVASLETLRSVVSSIDNPLLVFGHEPTQWSCVEKTARLDLNAEICVG
jgi:glyoxylase-like metal-dependent hydrolase (beta-lactamase superfamily II)